MKKFLLLPLVFALFFPGSSVADEFLEAPVLTQGKIMEKAKDRLQIKTALSHDEVLAFYKEALKDFKDIKYRNWSDSTYIEDDGSRPWHSITISKGGDETDIVILKDNWTWIIGTLVLRYIAVFVVLMVLLLGMTFSGKIISHSVKKAKARKASR